MTKETKIWVDIPIGPDRLCGLQLAQLRYSWSSWLYVLVCACAFFLLFGFMRIASAESEGAWFPFNLDWAGVTELSAEAKAIEPAGSFGFSEVSEDGHYYFGNKRLRFFEQRVGSP